MQSGTDKIELMFIQQLYCNVEELFNSANDRCVSDAGRRENFLHFRVLVDLLFRVVMLVKQLIRFL